MFYYLYEIKNLINNNIYRGVHQTKNIDDGYMGSGKVICRALEKYGIENFSKIILETFENSDAMFLREREVINEEFLARDDVYNLRVGGKGGWEYLIKTGANKIGRKNANRVMEQKFGCEWRSVLGKLGSSAANNPESKAKRKNTLNTRGIKSDASHMNTKKANEKRKETYAKIGHQQGTTNSQFGSLWITDGNTSKKIQKQATIPDGWYHGRKMN